MRVDPKWSDRLADLFDSLTGAFVLGCIAAAFITPLAFLWFAIMWVWRQ